MHSHCSVGVCSSPVHCKEIGRCFSAPSGDANRGDRRAEYLLRALVTANRERKMAQGTKDQALIRSAETRLARVWKDATEYVKVEGDGHA